VLWLFLLLIVGLICGYLLLVRRHRTRHLSKVEFWVYLPGERLPDQDRVMTRLLQDNPHPAGAISAAEGLLFSDVRLHVALVLRSRNAHVFRPDLFTEDSAPTGEILADLAEARAMAKLRYVSEEPLPDMRHIQFLAHLADAYADCGEASVIYDSTAERLWPAEAWREQLSRDRDATRPDLHVHVVWRTEGRTVVAETRGLVKIGLAELQTAPMEGDEKMIVGQVLEAAVEKLWALPVAPESVEVALFGDAFLVEIGVPIGGKSPVTILRRQIEA
jgi:hypothetical protein